MTAQEIVEDFFSLNPKYQTDGSIQDILGYISDLEVAFGGPASGISVHEVLDDLGWNDPPHDQGSESVESFLEYLGADYLDLSGADPSVYDVLEIVGDWVVSGDPADANWGAIREVLESGVYAEQHTSHDGWAYSNGGYVLSTTDEYDLIAEK